MSSPYWVAIAIVLLVVVRGGVVRKKRNKN